MVGEKPSCLSLILPLDFKTISFGNLQENVIVLLLSNNGADQTANHRGKHGVFVILSVEAKFLHYIDTCTL